MRQEATTEAKSNRTCMTPKGRCTPQERAVIDQKAANAGLSPSEYARRALLERVVVVRESLFDEQVIFQLGAIGNNLNQLTRKTHIHDDYDRERLRDILARIETVLDELV